MANDDHDQIRKDFADAVNMTPAALEKWLKTEDSKSVGWAGGENKTDSVGPGVGRPPLGRANPWRSSAPRSPTSPRTTTPG